MRAVRCLVLGLMVMAATGATPATALADSDPASDVLIAGDVFYPYAPVSKGVETQLNGLVKKAKSEHYPVKVALIGSVDDLGGAGGMYGQPQQYADFLASEISFNSAQRLVVVMPQGVGVANASGKQTDAALGVETDASQADSDGLAEQAMRAIVAMADAAGHDLPLPKGVGGGGGGGGGGGLSGASIAVFLVPVVLLLLALLLSHLKRREGEAAAEGGEE